MAIASDPADEHWNPASVGVWESRYPTDDHPTAISLRHTMFPFARPVDGASRAALQISLQATAHQYLQTLKRLGKLEGVPDEWLTALAPGKDDDTFGWLPIGWPPQDEENPDAGNPFVSFLLERSISAATEHDLTAVLLASERLSGKSIGSGFGIALVANLRRFNDTLTAQFVGVSSSFYGPDVISVTRVNWDEARIKQPELLKRLFSWEIKQEIAATLTLDSVFIRGVRLQWIGGDDEWEVERQGTGSSAGNTLDYSFAVVGTPTRAGGVLGRTTLHAHAASEARVFSIDPASHRSNHGYPDRRPSRSDDELDYYRTTVTGLPVPLVLGDGTHEWMRVIRCPGFAAADHDAGTNEPKSIEYPSGDRPPVHSDDFSALMAFVNASQAFSRLAAYGLDPFTYFRFASLPLRISYRSGMQAGLGKDGHTVNACVQVDGWPVDFTGPTSLGKRPAMEMHLALAEMSRRRRVAWTGGAPATAEPIGIATDDRWVWHEIGHVLLVAAVGELELRFAHSPGDALAAIALDPVSQLAAKGNWWRGMTFPWVFLPRRHDRSVTNGWSWGGTMHSALAQVPDSTAPRRKAYLSEQILSSSLFRLYRVLGGDTMEATAEDVNKRHTASHYCIFLIMRALQLMGTSPAVALRNDPEQLVQALILADAGTTLFDVPGDDADYRRTGGCAQKAIRWAFEAQGLYTAPGTVTNAPGQPPAVDLFIANGRSSETTENGIIEYGPGSYAPVSLHWDQGQTGDDTLPPWQAHLQAITLAPDGISVAVGNRGLETATDVTVTVWWHEWLDATAPPAWNDTGWKSSSPQPVPAQDIEPGAYGVFGPFPFAPASGRRFIILALASCPDDPACTDASTHLACASMKTQLVDLVTGDNNAGLRVVTLPGP